MTDEERKNGIYAELSRLKDLAGKMRAVADGLRKLVQGDYANGLGAVKDCWTGENADLFLGKARKVGDDMSETAKKLSEAADTLETIAKNYAESELRAIEIARSHS